VKPNDESDLFSPEEMKRRFELSNKLVEAVLRRHIEQRANEAASAMARGALADKVDHEVVASVSKYLASEQFVQSVLVLIRATTEAATRGHRKVYKAIESAAQDEQNGLTHVVPLIVYEASAIALLTSVIGVHCQFAGLANVEDDRITAYVDKVLGEVAAAARAAGIAIGGVMSGNVD
jgi:hypothetical protein